MVAAAGLSLTLTAPLLAPAAHAAVPLARRGVLDLRDWRPATDAPVKIHGEWILHWREWVAPGSSPGPAASSIVAPVPGEWSGQFVNGTRLDGHGFGTYELRILLPRSPPLLAIRLTSFGTAFRLFANGTEIASAGQVGRDAGESRPEYRPQVALLPELPGGVLELTLFVSNFDHARGGPWQPMVLGEAARMMKSREREIAFSLFLMGAILLMALYHFAAYYWRRRDPSPLFFGLTCMAVVLRLASTGERCLLDIVPGTGWSALLRAEYSSIVLSPAAFVLFQRSLFRADVGRFVSNAYVAAGVALGAIAWLIGSSTLTASLPLFEIHLLLGCALGLIWTVLAVVRRRDGSRVFAGGMLILVTAIVYDVILQKMLREDFLTPLGLFGFILSQAVLLSSRFANAIATEERLGGELRTAHSELATYAAGLEVMVAERTEALGRAVRQLEAMAMSDVLTGVGNRRLLDETLAKSWASHTRLGRSLSLILCDVDFFKRYNDGHGHLAGDGALVAVAAALRGEVHRPDDLVARFGGEEFVVMLPDTPVAEALRIAERMRESVQALAIPHGWSDAASVVTISAGVAALVPTARMTPEMLLSAADRALYIAKESGRNRIVAAPGPGSGTQWVS